MKGKWKKLLVYGLSFVMGIILFPRMSYGQQADWQQAGELVGESEELQLSAGVKYSGNKSLRGVLSQGDLLEESMVAKGARAGYNHAHDAKIVAALENLETVIDVRGFGITTKNVASVVSGIVNRNPQLFYLEKWGWSYQGTDVLELYFYLRDTKKVCLAQKKQVEEAVQEALDAADTSRMTREEIVLFYHDYLINRTAYAYDELLADKMPPEVFNVYGALVEHKAVCQGYAVAFEYLMQRLGIPCGYVSSKNVGHAWNVVKIGGKWYQVDTTWDDPVYDGLGYVGHTYFLLSDAKLLEYSPGREDMIVLLPGNETYPGTSDAAFQEEFWSRTDTLCYYYKGRWYYADKNKFQITEYNYKTKTKNVLVSDESRVWHVPGSNSYYGNYNPSKLAGSCHMLYYTTESDIYAINLNTRENRVVYSPDSTGSRIYGMAVLDGKISYVMRQNPGSKMKEEILQSGVAAASHTFGTSKKTKATCTKNGALVKKCSVCGRKDTKLIFASGHKYVSKTIKKATLSKNGTASKKCRVCKKTIKAPIYYPRFIELTFDSFSYNGRVRKPKVKVTDISGGTIPKKNYRLSYSKGCKNVGQYTVTISFKGNYTGTKTMSFTILPKETKLLRLSARKKGFVVKWAGQKTQVDGYEIQYGMNRKWKGSKKYKIKKNKITSRKVSGLKPGKEYYVRIRTYRKVNTGGKSKTLYSKWSVPGSVVTGK